MPYQVRASHAQVLVAMDCRNADGLVREALTADHGKGFWFSEHELSEFEIYRRNTAPGLAWESPRTRTQNTRKTGVYNASIVNSTDYNEIVALYRDAVDTGSCDHYTAVTALEQIARSFDLPRWSLLDQAPEDAQDPPSSTIIDPRLVEELVERIVQTVRAKELTPRDYAWIIWAAGKLRALRVPARNLRELVRTVDDKLGVAELSGIKVGLLAAILRTYEALPPESPRTVRAIAQIIANQPMDQISPSVGYKHWRR